MASASMRHSPEQLTEDSTDITLRGMVVDLEPYAINKTDGEVKTLYVMRIELLSSEHDKLTQLLHGGVNWNHGLCTSSSSCLDDAKEPEADIRRCCFSGPHKPTTNSISRTLNTQDVVAQCLRCKTVAENLKWITMVAFENAFGRGETHPSIDEVASRSNNLRVPDHIFQQLEREPNLSTARRAVVCINEVFDWYMPLIHNLPVDRYLTRVKSHFRSEKLHIRRLTNILNENENGNQNSINEEDRRAPIETEDITADAGVPLPTQNEAEIADIPKTQHQSNCPEAMPSVNSAKVPKSCLLWNGTVNLDILSTTDTLATIETCATTYKRASDVIRIIDRIYEWKRRM